MCVGAVLRQKTAVFVALLFTVLFSFAVITCASTAPFPHKGDLHLPQGTTVIPENAVTGIEEGDLYIPSGATLHLESNATFIWNPGYSIHNEGQITWDTGGRLRKGYLCVSVDEIHGCWQDPIFCADLPCPLGYVQWKDVWDLPLCDEEPVHFPDPILEQAIREAINKPTGDIYDTDLLGLTSFDAASRGIANLEGIQYCTDLTVLDLCANQISDISPLAGLTNLEQLELTQNQIGDISALSGLTNLMMLGLRVNQISDLSPLAGLTSLTELDLSNNQIVDISALSDLTNLWLLWLEFNQISDITPLSGLTNLTLLGLRANQISDITSLAALTSLVQLELYDNQMSDIAPLAGLTSITDLGLSGNQISDIAPLAGLTSITDLGLSGNQISDIAPLVGLTNLTYLALYDNQISDISALSDLTNLTDLRLWSNQISDITPLAVLTNLKQLFLSGNQISDIAPLAGLINLTRLELYDNQISDIAPLAGLTNLEQLRLHNNQISDIAPLAGLTNLWLLFLYSNQISDIAPLAGLINLWDLTLSHNQISDIAPLVSNAGIDSGDDVDVRWNYLTLVPGSADMQNIQALINRGVNVFYEPQNPPGNHPPIAQDSDISGQPQTMCPDTTYTVTAEYYDLDGLDDLKHCYLRLNHPTKPLTMMWYQSDGHAAPWAGDEGEDYVTTVYTIYSEIENGYRISWVFRLNDQWPEAENAIDFGVFAMDDSDASSGWEYDESKATFTSGYFAPYLSIPAQAPTRAVAHVGTRVTFAFLVRNAGTCSDTIELSRSGQGEWPITLSETTVELSPGAETVVHLSVYMQDADTKSITVTGRSSVDPSQASSITLEVKAVDDEGLFLVRYTFYNADSPEVQLGLSASGPTTLSAATLSIPPSKPRTVSLLFDPKKDETTVREAILTSTDVATGESVLLPTRFDADQIIATDFDMTTDSYSFQNFGPGILTNCFGMSDTCILYFEGDLKLPEGVTETYKLKKENVKTQIVLYQWRWLNSFVGGLLLLFPKDLSKQYHYLEDSISDSDPMILAVPGHAVVAYKIVIRGSLSYIFIYDSASPLIKDPSGFNRNAFPYAVYNRPNGGTFQYGEETKFLAFPRDTGPKGTLGDIVAMGLECPVHLRVTDQYGRAVSDEDVSGIPGAGLWWDGTGELTVVYLPVGLYYRVSLSAYEKGTFTFRVFFPVSYDTIYAYTYEEVSVEVGTVCSVNFAGVPLVPEMTIDLDGDGRIDATIPPLVEVLLVDGSQMPATPVPPTDLVIPGPNPIPPQGCIFWLDLPDDTTDATLKIFDIDGALLASIPLDPTADRYPAAGRWIPEDDLGRLLGTGLYLYLVEIEHTDGTVTYSPVQKMVIRR